MRSFTEFLKENTYPPYGPQGAVPSFAGAQQGLPPTNPAVVNQRDNSNLSKLLQALSDNAAGMQINNMLQRTKNATTTLAFAKKQFPQLVNQILGAGGATVPPPPAPRVGQNPQQLPARPLPGSQLPPPTGGIR